MTSSGMPGATVAERMWSVASSVPFAPAAPYGGGPGPIETAWPERDSRPRPWVVLGAVAVGAFAALTWVDRSVGLAVGVTLLAAGALMWTVARHRSHPWTVLCG
ncbi:MAG: hypothetical protein ACRCSN_07150, partial [Dermatophilaceae bacterium]